MSFKNKAVIVTGAGSGIGEAIAVGFAKEGANVAIVGRRIDRLNNTAQKCAAVGKKALIIAADVTKEEDGRKIINTTVDSFGKLDVLINNAGIIKAGSICEGNILESYDAVMNTNVRAALHLATLATPHLKRTKGNIINISSVATFVDVAMEFFTYSISKAALNHFTRRAAAELAIHGIRVNSVSPGPVETDILLNCDITSDWEKLKLQTALNRVSQPQDIADLVLFMASDKAKSVTGSNYICDNGMVIKG